LLLNGKSYLREGIPFLFLANLAGLQTSGSVMINPSQKTNTEFREDHCKKPDVMVIVKSCPRDHPSKKTKRIQGSFY
jgi:hypothetical protein